MRKNREGEGIRQGQQLVRLLEIGPEVVNNNRGVKEARDLTNRPTRATGFRLCDRRISATRNPFLPLVSSTETSRWFFPSLTLESAHHRGIDLGPGSRLRRRRRPYGKTTHVWPDPDLRSSGSFDGALEFSRQLLMVRFAPEGGDRFWLAFTAQGTDREDQKSGKLQF